MQKTIKHPCRCEGINITGTADAAITLEPAPTDTGIVFVRKDLPGHPEIHCQPENALSDSRWTSLVFNNNRVEHTEHLLAAITGLGIDNIRINLDSPYIPVISNFSSLDFVLTLLQAEPVFQDTPKKYSTIHEPHWVCSSFLYEGKHYDSVLLALPAPTFTLTYLLDYPGKQLPAQVAHYTITGVNDFLSELAGARSYIMDFEYDEVVKIIGQSIEDCLVISDTPSKLHWDNEPARHKLLDLLGDLSIMGTAIKGHFIGFRTGHKANIELCQKLRLV